MTLWQPRDDMLFEEWADAGRQLAQAHDMIAWKLGDWWHFGSHRYGERKALTILEDWTGPSFKTLMNYASICRAFPEETSRRREVSFSHHAEAAVLPTPEEREDALAWCLDSPTGTPRPRWELRDEVARRKQAAVSAAMPYEPFEHDRILLIADDCHEALPMQPENTVDLCMFSPPYGDLRNYDGNGALDLLALGEPIHRVLVDGGVCVVVIGNPMQNGRRNIDAYRIVVAWHDAGLHLWEPLIYSRRGVPGRWYPHFRVDHEQILVFVKGDRPNHIDMSHLQVPRVDTHAQPIGGRREREDNRVRPFRIQASETKCRGTIWHYEPTADNLDQTPDGQLRRQHPAPMPLRLAIDVVLCWTRPGDLVLDPMCGSGTVPLACWRTGRDCIGIDVSEKYINVAQQRLQLATADSDVAVAAE